MSASETKTTATPEPTAQAPATKPVPVAPIWEQQAETIEALSHAEVKTPADLESLLLDVQEHDHLTMAATITVCLIQGALARRRSIIAGAAVKKAKDLSERMSRYNKWVMANTAQALNPTVNLSMQLAFGVIDRVQYDACIKALQGAVTSAETKTTVAAAK